MIFKLIDCRCHAVRLWLALVLTMMAGSAWAQTTDLSTEEIQNLSENSNSGIVD